MNKVQIISAIILTALLLFGYLNTETRNKNLQKFYEITRLDPLFYDPTLELETFADALKNLSSAESNFRATQRRFLKIKNRGVFPAAWKLFPIDFLESLSEVSEVTASFLKNPEYVEAYHLLNIYRNAVNAYDRAATMHLEVIDNLLKQNPLIISKQVRFFGSATSLKIIQDDLLLIRENAEALEKEIELREKCLYWGKCNLDNSKRNTRTPNLQPVSSAAKTDVLLPLKIISPSNYDDVLGPYLVETGCLGWNRENGIIKPKSQVFYLFVEYKKNGSPSNIIPKLATENYYMDLNYWANTWQIADIFLEAGKSFYNQNATNNYRCSDLTYLPKLYRIAGSDIEKDGKTSVGELWGLPFIINEVTNSLGFLIREQQIEHIPTSALYLMTTRTVYSIFFMPFSDSIWRLKVTPQYLIEKKIPPLRGFVTYSELKTQNYSDDKIKSSDIFQRRILNEFIENKKNNVNAINITATVLKFINFISKNNPFREL